VVVTFHDLELDQAKLQEFCRRHRIARLSLFGSVLREDFSPESDVDVLVEFLPGARVSLFDVGGMAAELTEMLGREVDLRTAQDLSPYFRDDVLRTARPIYGV